MIGQAIEKKILFACDVGDYQWHFTGVDPMEEPEEKEKSKEITREFKEVREKDGTEHLELVGTISPEPPKEVTVESTTK